MDNGYEKTIKMTWDMKDQAYLDYKESKCASYADFIKKELAGYKIKRYSKKKNAA